ncbi:PREDICTED: chromatin assembly factor 1 subunit A [Nanorana parkeri]|uniref:chromatin assembly factor 1 subunit A n=1 Tax=Nanorana parkeri TaxID=125878 RepID=UPI00085450D7|nr:PREDICTED: chromatin assembly factor 1 subunit A [Nanorana parkeri]
MRPDRGNMHGISYVKPCSRGVQKKLVQARLPFKRLNPAPREKGEISQVKMTNVVQKASLVNTEYPLVDVENGCKMETGEVQLIPKTANGWGPLDNYVRKMSKESHCKPITIDLTEDSNSGPVEKLPSKGKVQSNFANGPAFPSSDVVRSPSLAQTDKDLEGGDCLKQSTSTNCFSAEEITEMSTKSPCSTELQTVMPVDSASSFTCADRENAEDEDTPLSLSSSPVSSPDALAIAQSPNNFSSPTGGCKWTSDGVNGMLCNLREKEDQLNRPKLQAKKEQRDHIREELKIAKERAKEEAKKKKDEEREQKAKKKMEKKEKDDREKAEKIRLKEEKKKEKLEALEAKQEEKRKKEEEKRLKEEEKRMKAEKAEITRFLQKSKNSDTPKTFAESCGKFAPFEIKKNMAVAPLCRVEFKAEKSEQLGKLIKEQNSKANFLLALKTRKPRRMGRTVIPKVPLVSDGDDVQVVIETDTTVHENITLECVVPERRMFGKMKLLQFCENHRPAYWGTWNRSSGVICPRRPWVQDTMLFDYEVDSDEEWEEDEPGESLSHSEGDDDDEDPKEEEGDDDDDDDDGFFVPHGYLSDDEGGVSDEECKNPENQKVRQRLKAKEWDELQSKGKKINVLKPILIGCIWLEGSKGEIAFLQKFSTCVLDSFIPIDDEMVQESTSRKLEDRAILMNLLPLLHGNVNGSKIIIQEFQECCRRGIILLGDGSNITVKESESPNACQQIPSSNIPSKARLKRIISENSVYEKRPDHRLCWYVYDDILKSFQQESLPVPCQWTYVTQLNPPNRDEVMTAGAQMQTTPSGKRKSAGSMPITKFMKKATVLGSFTNMAVTEADGFQADTEDDDDDDDDDDDCMIVEEQLQRGVHLTLGSFHTGAAVCVYSAV